MLRKKPVTGYEALTRSRRSRETEVVRSAPLLSLVVAKEGAQPRETAKTSFVKDVRRLERGHAFSYAALFAFTLVLYARPSEFYPSAVTNSMALVLALMTLGFFVPTQLALEGNITAPVLEVKLALLFGLLGIASVPLAINPSEAWQEFSGTFIRCIVIFVVIVNVARTEKRLKGLLYLALGVSVWLSAGAINDYRLGLLTVEGYRVAGRGSGIFGNSNDMALFLVTMVPIAITLSLTTRNAIAKLMFGAISVLMFGAIVVTYSRGGFIGVVVALGFLAWRLGNQRRLEILGAGFVLMLGFLLFAPGGYGLRLASIVIPSLDPVGSADARRGELTRSLFVALRHPLLGIGMGNYASEMSYHGLVTHNSYTQVAAEMGLAALCCYTMFIVSPLRKLAQIARETFGAQVNSRFYYLAVGLQASLLGYMVCSFFASVAYLWYVFYLVGYAVCLRRLYESEVGDEVVIVKRRDRKSALSQAPGIATAQ